MGYGTIPFPIASGFDDHKDAGVYFCAGCHAAGQKACSCLAEGNVGLFRRCAMVGQIWIEVSFFLTHTYHLAIACQHLMSSSSHSLLVRWVYLKMGVLQNLMVNHHIPYPMDFDGLMRCHSPQRSRCHSTPRRWSLTAAVAGRAFGRMSRCRAGDDGAKGRLKKKHT